MGSKWPDLQPAGWGGPGPPPPLPSCLSPAGHRRPGRQPIRNSLRSLSALSKSVRGADTAPAELSGHRRAGSSSGPAAAGLSRDQLVVQELRTCPAPSVTSIGQEPRHATSVTSIRQELCPASSVTSIGQSCVLSTASFQSDRSCVLLPHHFSNRTEVSRGLGTILKWGGGANVSRGPR